MYVRICTAQVQCAAPGVRLWYCFLITDVVSTLKVKENISIMQDRLAPVVSGVDGLSWLVTVGH